MAHATHISRSAINDAGASIVARVRRHFQYRAAVSATAAELHSLSDRDLTDLGIARTDIPRIARMAADETVMR